MGRAEIAVWFTVFAGLYVWMGFAVAGVLGKFAVPRSRAWIPVRRYVEAARVAEVPVAPVWISRLVAAASWLVFWLLALSRPVDGSEVGASEGKIAAISLVIGLAASLVGWILWIAGANRIELRLVREQRLWWVAALMPPLWATIVGTSSSRPVVAGPVAGAVPAEAPAVQLDDATRAIERVRPDRVPEPVVAQVHLAGEASMTADEYDVTGKYPRAFSPYDRSAPPSAADAAAARDESSEVHPVENWEYDDDDTIFTQRRRARWVIRVVGGEEYDLEDVTTIGREGIRPIPGVLSIIDDTRTMSKLHARLRRESDNWFITDLGSTNGTFVRDATGTELEVKAQSEARVDGTLLLGDLEVIIVDQREVA